MSRLRVGVLISGRGSNMMALVKAASEAGFPAEIVVVVSNKAEVAGLALARSAGVAAEVIESRGFGGIGRRMRRRWMRCCARHGVGLVCLAGYMRLLTPWFVASGPAKC